MPVDDVRVGDFSRPLVDPGKTPVPVTMGPSPTKDRLDAAERLIDEDARKDEEALKPMTSFEDRLKEAGIDKDKAAEIIDAVLLKSYYAEDIPLTKSIRARFRTRNARDTRRAQEQLETMRLSYDMHYNEAMARQLLAASLEKFAEDTLKFPPKGSSSDIVEKMFFDRLAYVDALSDPALRLLLVKLTKFDRMVATCLEEGSIENF